MEHENLLGRIKTTTKEIQSLEGGIDRSRREEIGSWVTLFSDPDQGIWSMLVAARALRTNHLIYEEIVDDLQSSYKYSFHIGEIGDRRYYLGIMGTPESPQILVQQTESSGEPYGLVESNDDRFWNSNFHIDDIVRDEELFLYIVKGFKGLNAEIPSARERLITELNSLKTEHRNLSSQISSPGGGQ